MSLVGQTIHDGVSMMTSLDVVVSTLPKMAINNVPPSDGASVGPPDPIPADVNTTKDTTTQQSRTVAIEDELIHHINHSSGKGWLRSDLVLPVPSPYVEKKRLFGVKWVQFIDSGGQLQYHDILPLFIRNPGVTVFTLDLSEELSHHPSTEYYGADGKPVGKPYRSSLSHKQILQHCLGAVHSQDAHPLVVAVGTHRDSADKCSESISETNQYLKALLDPSRYRVLYKGERLKEVIFPVNCKAPQDEDRRVAKVLREKIVSVSPQSFKMSIAWFGLEIHLLRTSEDGVLSLVQCQACATRLHMEGDAFSAVLHHLVQHNVFLYYPEVLPQTVFCNPQAVLTKVTELVQYHHKLRDNPDEDVAAEGDLVMFRDRGLVSVKLLRKFPKYYTEAPQGWLHRAGSTELAPQGWLHIAGSTRLAPQSWLHRAGSTELAPQSWLHRAGSTGLAPQSWLHRAGSTELAPQSWLHRAGSTELAPQSWLHRAGSTGLAPQGWLHRAGSTGLAPQSWLHRAGSTLLAPQGWLHRAGSTELAPQSWLHRAGSTGLAPQSWLHRAGSTAPQSWFHRAGSTGLAGHLPL